MRTCKRTVPTLILILAGLTMTAASPVDAPGPRRPNTDASSGSGGHRGVACPADLNGDGLVGSLDMPTFFSEWGWCPECPSDFNGDDVVDVRDLLTFIASWGSCP